MRCFGCSVLYVPSKQWNYRTKGRHGMTVHAQPRFIVRRVVDLRRTNGADDVPCGHGPIWYGHVPHVAVPQSAIFARPPASWSAAGGAAASARGHPGWIGPASSGGTIFPGPVDFSNNRHTRFIATAILLMAVGVRPRLLTRRRASGAVNLVCYHWHKIYRNFPGGFCLCSCRLLSQLFLAELTFILYTCDYLGSDCQIRGGNGAAALEPHPPRLESP